MNKIKFLPIVLFASAITLASCNFLGGSSSKKKSSKKSSSGENTSLTSSSTEGDSGSSKSGSTGGTSKSSSGGSSKSSSSSGKTSSSSGKTSSGSSSSGTTTTTSGGGESQYTALGIMQDVGTSAWGFFEEGDFNDPDDDGIVTSNFSIGVPVETLEDTAECLSGAFDQIILDEDFPSYLQVLQGPTYIPNAITTVTPNLGVSTIYLVTDDYEFILYMYDYVDTEEESVTIIFEAGPISAYQS